MRRALIGLGCALNDSGAVLSGVNDASSGVVVNGLNVLEGAANVGGAMPGGENEGGRQGRNQSLR